jgi:hypothetical protein
MLAACGSPQLVAQRAAEARPASSSGNALLYVTDWKAGKILVFSYPTGPLVQSIADNQYPLGLCTDADGNVWVMNFGGGENQVVEYAHGGTTPIATLDDAYGEPRSCSVDRASGSLAVVNPSPPGVVIYPSGSGSPQMYSPDLDYPFACTYDANGNLFVDGYHLHDGDHFRLSELARGSTHFARLSVKGAVGLPGDLEWDGADLAVGDYQSPGVIYRLEILHRKKVAMLVGTTTLDGPARQAPEGVEFSLDQGSLIMPFGDQKNVNKIGFWNYPGGGYYTSELTRFGGEELYGVAVSALPSR